ncbi:PqqD family peptide modification chaperone [Tessaracoccus sp. Z1128]
MIRRTPVTDFLAVDGESLALVDNKVLRLGPVATLILEVLEDGPTTLPRLARDLEAAFGAPPDGGLEAAVASQVAALTDNGLLTVDEEPVGQDGGVTP